MNKIPLEYFYNEDVVSLARDLLGKKLLTRINGQLTGGIITETEAYAGVTDRASHAYSNRRTKRTEVMYRSGGRSYVYLCYGLHHLLNIVSNKEGVPHAILIRALLPTVGLETMLKRRGKKEPSPTLTKGPGTVAQALGLTLLYNNVPLDSETIWLEEGKDVPDDQVTVTTRVGVDYAGPDALKPWRFIWKTNDEAF